MKQEDFEGYVRTINFVGGKKEHPYKEKSKSKDKKKDWSKQRERKRGYD